MGDLRSIDKIAIAPIKGSSPWKSSDPIRYFKTTNGSIKKNLPLGHFTLIEHHESPVDTILKFFIA